MELITSRQNSVIRHVKKLSADRKYRRTSGEFLCEGPKMLSEAERWGFVPRTILACSEPELQPWEGRAARTVLVSPELLSYAADTETPQGLLFTCELPEEPEKL
ncbi:MAG: RNA methyltransferase, partial [Oscillospiraceae bacterium]